MKNLEIKLDEKISTELVGVTSQGNKDIKVSDAIISTNSCIRLDFDEEVENRLHITGVEAGECEFSIEYKTKKYELLIKVIDVNEITEIKLINASKEEQKPLEKESGTK